MKSFVLHLIRNMPCEGNLEGRYIGRTESPLASSSIAQLLDMKNEYVYPQAKAFYASPSTRCVDTLKLIYPHADPEVILEMAECDFGDWENKTAEELQDSEEFKIWTQNSSKAAPPNGESGEVFAARVIKGFNMLVENLVHYGHDEALLVTYGGVIMTLLSAFGLPRANFYDWMCEPGAGYSIRIMPSHWQRAKVFEVFEKIPTTTEEIRSREYSIVDIAREAANRAYGTSENEEDENGF